MLVSRLLSDLSADLSDTAKTRWGNTRLLEFINAAQLQVVLVRPDANALYQSIQLVAGTKQSIPATGLRFLDAIRNMGATGSTPGEVISVSHRHPMDAMRSWHTSATKTVVKDSFFDDRFPMNFFVFPPVPASPAVWIEIGYSKAPAQVTDPVAGVLELADVYYEPIRQWSLYRAYAQNQQSAVARTRAREYETSFYQSLGVKLRVDMMVSPNQATING